MNSPPRILVVDDEEYNRILLERLVNELGYQCDTACDGLETLAKVKLDIDLVLLDVVMPGINGFEVVRRIKSDPDTGDIPVIMVTSLDSREDRLRAVDAGASDFISKPVDLMELKVRIASVLRAKAAQDELKKHKAELEIIVLKRTEDLINALAEMVVAQRETHEAYLETINRLAIAAEFKDSTTAAHIARMSRYCRVIADAVHLPPAEAEIIQNASPMHDVGKINLPDEILMKPGKLTDPEWKQIKKHPEYGARILQNSESPLLKAGEVIALTHHEKWNGSGYPAGSRGKDTHIYGRLCAVADVWDALTMERPYKPKISNHKALSMMKGGMGTHFDPELLEAFLDSIKEIEAIQNDISA